MSLPNGVFIPGAVYTDFNYSSDRRRMVGTFRSKRLVDVMVEAGTIVSVSGCNNPVQIGGVPGTKTPLDKVVRAILFQQNFNFLTEESFLYGDVTCTFGDHRAEEILVDPSVSL